MSEHRIQFRGGWEAIRPGASPDRLTLPVAWPIAASGTIRLVRRFGRPPLDPGAESVSLELQDVPGLIGLEVNSVKMGELSSKADAGVVPLDGLLGPRNVLTFDVDLDLAGAGEWGRIALVILPKSNDRDPSGRPGGVG